MADGLAELSTARWYWCRSDAQKRLDKSRKQRLEPKWCVGSRGTDAWQSVAGRGDMDDRVVSDLQVACMETPAIIRKGAGENQRKFKAPVSVVGHRLSCGYR